VSPETAKLVSPLMGLLVSLRPRQWVKNGVLLAGILFTLDHRHPLDSWLRVAAAVLVFCALSSAIYLVNDVCDADQDRQHPRKRRRPIAAGHVAPWAALLTAAALASGGLAAAATLGVQFAGISLAYLGLTVSYSLWLKHAVILDVMALAGCYVIRAAAGAIVIAVEISPWLLVCTTLGALVLGLAKRRTELVTLEAASDHRRILAEYSVTMLDQMIGVVTAGALMAYMLYTFFSPTGQQHPLMMLTIPFVVFGIFRFLYIMHRHEKGGDPSADLIEDRQLVVCGVLWAATAALVMYIGS
jgi:4-hydroxybenzoate polyprenyltransferase